MTTAGRRRSALPGRARPLPRLLSLAAATVLVVAAGAAPAWAGFSVEIAPAQVELTLDRGERSDQTIGVRNHDTEPIDLTVVIRDFELTADGGFEMREPGHTTFSAGRWVQFPRDTIRLGPDETRLFDYSILVPEDAESGGHYAAIVFEGKSTAPDAEGGGSELTLVGQVAAEILITVPGPIDRTLMIDSFKLPRIAFGAGADYADVVVRNAGNVHLTPNGYVQTWGGLPAGPFDSEFGQFTLLPGASRHFRVALENTPWLGRMGAKTELLFGPTISEFDRSVAESGDYLVVSWKLILILDIVLIGFDLVLFREWRRRVARRTRALQTEAAPS